MNDLMRKDIEYLKDQIFALDNNNCFIERERIIGEMVKKLDGYTGADYRELIFKELLERVSTPIDERDVFGGRIVEAVPDEGMKVPSEVISSYNGHKTLDWEMLLSKGLKGILDEAEANAQRLGDDTSAAFVKNIRICIEAVAGYAKRYSKAALALADGLEGEHKKNILRMAKTLENVPYGPAYDFYSALQSIWLVHMITSCYAGGRDYALGRMDQYLYPYYEKDISSGTLTREDAINLLAYFYIKTNEVCGMSGHRWKPILSVASRQYIIVGGCDASGKSQANDLSQAILEAGKLSDLAQPLFIVRLDPDADKEFSRGVFKAMHFIKDRINVYNDRLIFKMLADKGIPADIAADFTFSACSSIDLNYRTTRICWYSSLVHYLCDVLGLTGNRQNVRYENIQQILDEFSKSAYEIMQEMIRKHDFWDDAFYPEGQHLLSSFLTRDCIALCRKSCDGGTKYRLINIYLAGLATVADSLAAIDKMVFIEKRYSLDEFIKVAANNFDGHEILQMEAKNSAPKFGNDSDADRYAVMAANAILDAVEKLELPEGYIAAPGFYSLEEHRSYGKQLPATPDGRLAGQPVSENQSPVYGCDTKGITALLKSLSKLPFHRTCNGGLNLSLSMNYPDKILEDIVCTYFRLGGFHTGISVIDRQKLEEAVQEPDKYKTLMVRVGGYSEYFVNLSQEMQFEILSRTVNTVPTGA